jgi:DNA-binding CsgD family transcriptional regulator
MRRSAWRVHRPTAHAPEARAWLSGFSSPHERELPLLTPRELECLRWTMSGKTAWEVARILGISEQTAARHLSRAIRKLDCVNKHQAVLKALKLGLIP